ncbi:hypothetical protein [Desulfotruncus alcoholivorax]|uniref:hypothetical protein n=1 Tax=Desulfotruncus alcoholivorax TaxID=265477 RepID=UPI00042624EA|nr:hypothetical protein [Desulfotruncus alcoholivorax]
MTRCPMAYASDPCKNCEQYGNCAPSQMVRKMEELERQIKELKRMLDRNDKFRYARIS